MGYGVITVGALSERLLGPDPPVILDVRETEELAIARLENAVHLPLSEFSASIGTLDPDMKYAIVCHHGIRSAHAAQLMMDRGFKYIWNVEGGIDAWARQVDPAMQRY